jgi:hypothetical protein
MSESAGRVRQFGTRGQLASHTQSREPGADLILDASPCLPRGPRRTWSRPGPGQGHTDGPSAVLFSASDYFVP